LTAAKAQVAPSSHAGGRPNQGINATVRDLGIDRTEAQRAIKINGLSDEAKDAARAVGLDNNQSALLEAAKVSSSEAATIIREIAEQKEENKRNRESGQVITFTGRLSGRPSHRDPDFESFLEEHGIDNIPATQNHRAQGSGDNEWYTPAIYVDAARIVLGNIDLDPASSELANRVVRADTFFTIADNGLEQDWTGNVWLNPPYAQPLITHFMEKLATEISIGSVNQAIALTHNYTDTAWFHMAASSASAICFTRGRIGFLDPNGEKAAPTQGQAFFSISAEM
jgi:phage N-6-adenine-methyltransferase